MKGYPQWLSVDPLVDKYPHSSPILDAGAVAFPFVPAGAGTALKTYRAADKVTDTAKLVGTQKVEQLMENIQKGRDFETKVGKNLGEIKASQVTYRQQKLILLDLIIFKCYVSRK